MSDKLNVSRINPGDMLEIIKVSYALRLEGIVPIMHGSPGIGKSSIGAQAAKDLGINFIDVRLGQIMAEDLRGLPYLDREAGASGYLPPDFLPRDGAGILMLDEITCSDQRVQNAALELLLDRRLGSYKLPDGYMILAAGNDASHGALTFELSTAAADRMMHYHVVADPEQWVSWAQKNELDPSVVTFIKMRPDYLDGIEDRVNNDKIAGPSPRGWHKVSRVIKHVKNQDQRDVMIAGTLGQEVAIDFRQIMEEVNSYAPIEDILKAKGKERLAMMPKSLAGLYGLIYGLRAFVKDYDTACDATNVINLIIDVDTNDHTVPLSELHRLGFEIILEAGATKVGGQFLSKFRNSKEWERFKEIDKEASQMMEVDYISGHDESNTAS